jgi:hypothetical protein
VNQTVPGLSDGLRLHLLIINGVEKTAAITDVATPFESRYAAFEAVRKEKRNKDDGIADQYRQQGYDVYVDVFT